MKIVVVMADKRKAEILIEQLRGVFETRDILQYMQQGCDLIGDIKKEEPDLLLTVNLEGFERETLTDNIAYNFLECKQVHFLFERNLTNERYLKKMLSIAMFFYCTDEGYKEELLQKYPDIPWIKSLEDFRGVSSYEVLEDTKKENVIDDQMCKKVYEAIQEVIKECGLNI